MLARQRRWQFPSPAHQKASVAKYLTTTNGLPPPMSYNGQGRGYPDISAVCSNTDTPLGTACPVQLPASSSACQLKRLPVPGACVLVVAVSVGCVARPPPLQVAVEGTSESSPTMAGIFSMVRHGLQLQSLCMIPTAAVSSSLDGPSITRTLKLNTPP